MLAFFFGFSSLFPCTTNARLHVHSFPSAGSWSMVATLVSCKICSLPGKSGTTNVRLQFSCSCSHTAILIIICRRWSQATGINMENLPCIIFCRRYLFVLLAFILIPICIPQINHHLCLHI